MNGTVESWRDPQGVEWVRAQPNEYADLIVTFTRTLGLPPLRLVQRDVSLQVKRIERRARREQRAMKVRGLA